MGVRTSVPSPNKYRLFGKRRVGNPSGLSTTQRVRPKADFGELWGTDVPALVPDVHALAGWAYRLSTAGAHTKARRPHCIQLGGWSCVVIELRRKVLLPVFQLTEVCDAADPLAIKREIKQGKGRAKNKKRRIK